MTEILLLLAFAASLLSFFALTALRMAGPRTLSERQQEDAEQVDALRERTSP